MNLEGGRIYKTPFDLADAGEEQDRLDNWCEVLFNQLSSVQGVEIYYCNINIETDLPKKRFFVASYPANFIESENSGKARNEAIRLQRIAIAGSLPGDENQKKQNTSISIPLSNKIGGSQSAISIEGKFLNTEILSKIIELTGACFGWPAYILKMTSESYKHEIEIRSFDALQAIISLTETKFYNEAIRSLTTDLAERFECERVALGLSRRNHIKLEAISHVGNFKRSMPLSQKIVAAMEEAFDQKTITVWPPAGDGNRIITTQHSILAENNELRQIITIPMIDGTEYVGALLFERQSEQKLDRKEIEFLETLSSVLTPLILEKKLNSKLLIFKVIDSLIYMMKIFTGRTHFGYKLSLLALIALFFILVYIERPHVVTADIVVQGVETRTVSAPFDGFISEVNVSEGERVQENDLLLQLDIRELTIERMRLAALSSQTSLELDRAISARDRAETALVEARVRQIEAQMALIEQQIERSKLRAPFDALVISGDLSRSVGRATARGEPLLTLSPIEEYKVIVDVLEKDVSSLSAGMTGTMRLSPLPERRFDFSLAEFVPIARYEDNKTIFSFEAELSNSSSTLLHGMTGSARIEVNRKPLYKLWGKPILDAARMWLWRNFTI
jgi:hypothetical protein